MLKAEPILTGDKMEKKEKIRWILAIFFSLFALILCIEIIRCEVEMIAIDTVQEEPKDGFVILGQLAGAILGFIAILIAGIVSFSSASLGAFFAYSFKDNEIKFVKLTCRILFIVDILCIIESVVVLCIFLL